VYIAGWIKITTLSLDLHHFACSPQDSLFHGVPTVKTMTTEKDSTVDAQHVHNVHFSSLGYDCDDIARHCQEQTADARPVRRPFSRQAQLAPVTDYFAVPLPNRRISWPSASSRSQKTTAGGGGAESCDNSR
jgi:hypothetical protein